MCVLLVWVEMIQSRWWSRGLLGKRCFGGEWNRKEKWVTAVVSVYIT
jgi:hypothetical protein